MEWFRARPSTYTLTCQKPFSKVFSNIFCLIVSIHSPRTVVSRKENTLVEECDSYPSVRCCSKVELIPSTVTDEVSALKTESVDAIWIFYGWAGVACQVAGLETDYFAFADIDPVLDYYTPVVISNNEFLEENPETAKAFLAALAKGYEDAIADPEVAADILCKAAPELDKELVLASQKYLSDQYKAEVERWGYIDPARWNAFYQWLNETGLSNPKLPENVGFTNDYLPE